MTRDIDDLKHQVNHWLCNEGNIQERVEKCIRRVLRSSNANVNLQQTLASDLGMDSLHFVELSCEFEDEFRVGLNLSGLRELIRAENDEYEETLSPGSAGNLSNLIPELGMLEGQTRTIAECHNVASLPRVIALSYCISVSHFPS